MKLHGHLCSRLIIFFSSVVSGRRRFDNIQVLRTSSAALTALSTTQDSTGLSNDIFIPTSSDQLTVGLRNPFPQKVPKLSSNGVPFERHSAELVAQNYGRLPINPHEDTENMNEPAFEPDEDQNADQDSRALPFPQTIPSGPAYKELNRPPPPLERQTYKLPIPQDSSLPTLDIDQLRRQSANVKPYKIPPLRASLSFPGEPNKGDTLNLTNGRPSKSSNSDSGSLSKFNSQPISSSNEDVQSDVVDHIQANTTDPANRKNVTNVRPSAKSKSGFGRISEVPSRPSTSDEDPRSRLDIVDHASQTPIDGIDKKNTTDNEPSSASIPGFGRLSQVNSPTNSSKKHDKPSLGTADLGEPEPINRASPQNVSDVKLSPVSKSGFGRLQHGNPQSSDSDENSEPSLNTANAINPESAVITDQHNVKDVKPSSGGFGRLNSVSPAPGTSAKDNKPSLDLVDIINPRPFTEVGQEDESTGKPATEAVKGFGRLNPAKPKPDDSEKDSNSTSLSDYHNSTSTQESTLPILSADQLTHQSEKLTSIPEVLSATDNTERVADQKSTSKSRLPTGSSTGFGRLRGRSLINL
ncbi:hypothetical protein CROQUDRAFT_91700 [Cronartium quercuum f. sp. fusiforme G11]|uniref:Uncharacterized protein n=1 Tax=Cronartium quercuum f. sp. fusiforme G11 TaxID=708437 RepID=A0A9P6NN93_9BASI|nr:hypothetical protein CROQUDRAFT_91700 [Cronartium quercuum f. sp. fusiforme G11]